MYVGTIIREMNSAMHSFILIRLKVHSHYKSFVLILEQICGKITSLRKHF